VSAPTLYIISILFIQRMLVVPAKKVLPHVEVQLQREFMLLRGALLASLPAPELIPAAAVAYALPGTVRTSVADYVEGHPDFPAVGDVRYSELITSGSDLSSYWSSITTAMANINSSGYLYLFGSQNSNTVIDYALAQAGLRGGGRADDACRQPDHRDQSWLHRCVVSVERQQCLPTRADRARIT
jgi:hypothetical protein